jgi:hypothetical protein
MKHYQVPLLTIFCLLVVNGSGCPRAQESAGDFCKQGGYELWVRMRILPVQFIKFDNKTAFWKYQDTYVVKLDSFILSEKAQYISKEKKLVDLPYIRQHLESEWLCYYCSDCHTLLRAYELRANSLLLSEPVHTSQGCRSEAGYRIPVVRTLAKCDSARALP